MAHQTEAACLLETGAMYGKRLLLHPPTGGPIFAGFRPGVFSLYFGDAPIYHFDREGRWQRAFIAGTHYLKGLDATVQAIDRVREGANMVLKRRTLGHAEASDLDAQVRTAALELLDALEGGRLASAGSPRTGHADIRRDELRDTLERVAGLGRGRLVRPPRALPRNLRPDAHPSPRLPEPLVLQATLGHAGGVAFGRGRGRARGPHARRIRRARPGRPPPARPAARTVPDGIPGRRQRPPPGSRDRRGLPRNRRRDVPHRPRKPAGDRRRYPRDRRLSGRESTPFSMTSPRPRPAGPTGGGCARRHLRRVSLGRRVGRPGDPVAVRQELER